MRLYDVEQSAQMEALDEALEPEYSFKEDKTTKFKDIKF
jgi:hypothetical protein